MKITLKKSVKTKAMLLGLALLGMTLTTPTWAQRGGRSGGERSGGGRPGGGMGGFGGPSLVGLLQLEEVREEIDLMPDQIEAMKKLAKANTAKRPKFPGRDASADDRREMMQKMMKQQQEQAAKIREQLEEVLLPDQFERLDQISVQARGLAALQDVRIAKALAITDTQREQMKVAGEKTRNEIRESMRKRFSEMRSGGSGGREEIQSMMKEIRETAESKILEVLSKDQRKQFEEMKGEPFEMPQSAFGGRGPGGRGPGGPGLRERGDRERGAGGRGRGGRGRGDQDPEE